MTVYTIWRVSKSVPHRQRRPRTGQDERSPHVQFGVVLSVRHLHSLAVDPICEDARENVVSGVGPLPMPLYTCKALFKLLNLIPASKDLPH